MRRKTNHNNKFYYVNVSFLIKPYYTSSNRDWAVNVLVLFSSVEGDGFTMMKRLLRKLKKRWKKLMERKTYA